MDGLPTYGRAITPNQGDNGSRTENNRYVPKWTGPEYVEAIGYHSTLAGNESFFPGEIYDTLKRFLVRSPVPPRHDNLSYATLFDLTNNPGTNPRRAGFQGFDDPDRCIKALEKNIQASEPQLLFLRGHPSSEWIREIGAFCRVDPELFRWFLRYKYGSQGNNLHFGAAPSCMSNIIRFKFFTIGASHHRSSSTQEEVDRLRNEAAENLRQYRDKLWANTHLKRGDSVVRDFHILDEIHCVIEQEVSVCVFDIAKTWMAVACTDAGANLFDGPPLPLIGDKVDFLRPRLLPTPQYQARCSLKSESIYQTRLKPSIKPQSLALLSEGYGTTLNRQLARSDRFYSLSELFRLSAFSEQQFLNVIEEKIALEVDLVSLQNPKPTLANLFYFRSILDHHLSHINYMLQMSINKNEFLHHGRRSGVQESQGVKSAAQQSAVELLSLYQDLQAQAQMLREKCSLGMTVMSNTSMIAESRRAIDQAELVTKLTFSAFVYLPFTFASSFFGMNFKEFGTGKHSIYAFFALSLPVFIASMVFYYWDQGAINDAVKKLRIRQKPSSIGGNIPSTSIGSHG